MCTCVDQAHGLASGEVDHAVLLEGVGEDVACSSLGAPPEQVDLAVQSTSKL